MHRLDRLSHRLSRIAAPACAFICTAAMAAAQAAGQSVPDLPQASPKARVEQRVGLTDFSITYSSPGVKDRKIWGALVPYDVLWRTGANAATKLEASREFTFGGRAVPAGSYALYTIPGKKTWTVILNTNANTGGTSGYDEKNNVASVTVKPEKAEERERLAFLFADTSDDATRLDLEWDKLRVSVPIQVSTATQVRTNIDKAIDDAWRPHFNSARWLLDSDGDLPRALTYIDTSIAIKATWWNHWVKAQILAKQGHASQAVATAEQAQTLGAGDPVFEGFFKESIAKAIADWKKQS